MGYCHIPIESIHIHGVGFTSAIEIVVSMYFASLPAELSGNTTLGFIDGWLSRTYTLNVVRSIYTVYLLT